MDSKIHSPQPVPAGALHTGDTILVTHHGQIMAVVLVRIYHGTTMSSSTDHGRDIVQLGYQTPDGERFMPGYGTEDLVGRVAENLAAVA